MPTVEAPLPGLIRTLYESVSEPSKWPVFLEHLRTQVEASSMVSLQHDLDEHKAVGQSTGLEQAELEKYFRYYVTVNPWLTALRPSDYRPDVAEGETVLPLSAIRKTEFYNDWGRRNEVVHSVVAPVEYAKGKLLYLCANRGERQGRFRPESLVLLHELLPHLRNAFRIDELMTRARRSRMLPHSEHQAAIFLRADGTVAEMTKAAELMLEVEHWMAVGRRGRVRLAGTGETKAFDAAVASALRSDAGEPVMMRAGNATHALIIRRLMALVPSIAPGGAALAVLILSPRPVAGDEAIRLAGSLYGLTDAESGLLVELVKRETLAAACEARGVTRNTGKSQLAGIFHKTGTRSQVGLMLLVAQLITRLGDVSRPDDLVR